MMQSVTSPSDALGMALAESGAVLPGAHLPLIRSGVLSELPVTRFVRAKPVVLALYYLGLLTLFSAADYPRSRVIGVGVVLAISIASQLFAMTCVKHRSGGGTRGLLFAQYWHLGIITVAYALTGGLASPMIVSMLTPLVGSLVIFGRGRETRMTVAGLGLGTIALALLPSAVRGPAVAQPWGMAIAALSILCSLTIMWTSMTALIEAYREKGKQLHRAREEMVEQALARARSLEQVGSKVAHELKNPLAAVKGLVQLLGRNAQEGDRSKERLAVVEREVARMEAILAEYLTFSRPLEELKTDEVDLHEVASDVLAVLEARAQTAGVELSTSGAARAHGDPRRIKEALLNLVANAVEATPSGGSVSVELENRICGGATLRIKDTGRGMSQEVLERVGTPFFTTREEGTGLGVTLARNAFFQHGGDLRYESKPGAGTTVTAFIPNRNAQQPKKIAGCGGMSEAAEEARLFPQPGFQGNTGVH